MVRIKSSLLTLLLVFCFLLLGSIVNSQQISEQVRSETTTFTSEPELAKTILSETGIAHRYNLYLGNAIDIAVPPSDEPCFGVTNMLEQAHVWKTEKQAKRAISASPN
jgi:hypothetical protein